ncbi:MAG: hypothetical protein IKE30_03420 [Clostridia bacterium]|nr:hypothetical protein [Clostridia bacterium]
MREYTICRFSGWEAIETLPIDTRLWCPEVEIRAFAQIAWDDAALHVRLTAEEKQIRAVHTGPCGMPCEDSCLEFFLAPFPEDPRYINIEFNPNACCYLGLGGNGELVRLLPEKDWLSPKAFFTETGWGIEYRVPFDFVRLFFPGFAPAPGCAIRANCFKCGDLTETEHYFSWNPVTSPTPNFHRPCDFGRMVFG